MAKNSHFQRGHYGSGCYKCNSCGKLTRETGEGESSCKLCYTCYEESGYWNAHSDGHHEEVKDKNCPFCNGTKEFK